MASSGPLTQDQSLALLKRTSDEGWFAAETSSPDGTAVINSRTAIAAATSQALMDQAATTTISDAPGGTPGVCTLTVARRDSTNSILIPRGYKFVTAEGIELVLPSDIVIPVGALTFDLPLQTLRQTELVNTYVPAFDSILQPGDRMDQSSIGLQEGRSAVSPDSPPVWDSGHNRVLRPIGLPDNDFVLRYSASTQITLAASDWLSAHGNERGQRRNSGETTEEYRARIRLFPDAVSPIAISTAVHAAANNAGLPNVYLQETFASGASPALIEENSLSLADTVFDGDYCDDTVGVALAEKQPWRTQRLVSIREGRAYFRLVMDGLLKEPDGAVLYCDDGYCDDSNWGYPDVGISVRTMGALMTVPAVANQIRSGGVLFDYFIEDASVIPSEGVAVGETTRGLSVAWTLNAPPGTGWILRDGIVSNNPSGWTGKFVDIGQGPLDWIGLAVAPPGTPRAGNVYGIVQHGDIYVRVGGVGDFVPLHQTSRDWRGPTVVPAGVAGAGNVYATDYGLDIYMQTAGTGDFNALSQAHRYWSSIASHPNGNVYATVNQGGGIYMQTAGTGDFALLGYDPRSWDKVVVDQNGNVFAFEYQSADEDTYTKHGYHNVWIQTRGVGPFVNCGKSALEIVKHQPGAVESYIGIDIAPNGDWYLAQWDDNIYLQRGGTGPVVPLGQEKGAWNAIAVATDGVYASRGSSDIYFRSNTSLWHQVRFTFADGTTFTTPAFDDVGSEHFSGSYMERIGVPFKPVTRIEGLVWGDGSHIITLLGTFWAIPYTL
jgi:hypothetical protein